jgi:hypothetical protein
MRYRAIVMLMTLACVVSATELPTATVSGRLDDEEKTHKDGRATTALGLAVAAFGSARVEFVATKERWEAATKTNHVRVRFAKPVTLTANTGSGEGKSYAVDEILICTTPFAKRPPLPTPNGKGYIEFGDKVDPGLEDSLLIRSGDKYFSFIKYEGILAVPLITMYGPR